MEVNICLPGITGVQLKISSWCLVGLVALSTAHGQVMPRDLGAQMEARLQAGLEWKLLWETSAAASASRPAGSIKVILYLSLKDDALSYCSSDMGACATYSLNPIRYWNLRRSEPCRSEQTNESCLVAFLRLKVSPLPTGGQRQGLRKGVLGATSALCWSTSINLPTRTELENRARSFRPETIDSLINWLRLRLSGAGYSSLRVPCYRSTDPQIYVYAERKVGAPLILIMIRNRRDEEWEEAGVISKIDSQVGPEGIKRLIFATTCRVASIED